MQLSCDGGECPAVCKTFDGTGCFHCFCLRAGLASLTAPPPPRGSLARLARQTCDAYDLQEYCPKQQRRANSYVLGLLLLTLKAGAGAGAVLQGGASHSWLGPPTQHDRRTTTDPAGVSLAGVEHGQRGVVASGGSQGGEAHEGSGAPSRCELRTYPCVCLGPALWARPRPGKSYLTERSEETGCGQCLLGRGLEVGRFVITNGLAQNPSPKLNCVPWSP